MHSSIDLGEGSSADVVDDVSVSSVSTGDAFSLYSAMIYWYYDYSCVSVDSVYYIGVRSVVGILDVVVTEVVVGATTDDWARDGDMTMPGGAISDATGSAGYMLGLTVPVHIFVDGLV